MQTQAHRPADSYSYRIDKHIDKDKYSDKDTVTDTHVDGRRHIDWIYILVDIDMGRT